MHIYNSLTRRLESFQPAGQRVGVYTCGITPYDTTHLGHAFTYAVSDILIRYLQWLGYPVTYVQNVTDIDDDILKKASEVGEDWRALGDRWTAHFIQDMTELNMRPPDYFPRATAVIPDIQQIVQNLLERGVAYEKEGSVYYDIHAWEEYGKLSGMNEEEMLPVANERGNNPDDPNKRSPLDFVLWQASSAGEPAWESPWGMGRPGWHIECSTMSTKYLDGPVDVHLGGNDLLFPHHECEIAQVEPLGQPKPFVRHWMHAAMVRYEGEKMSKSLGNLIMVRDLLREYSADAIRIYLAMHHYRKAWSHDENQLIEAARLARRLRTALAQPGGSGSELNPIPQRKAFTQAMNNDLDTAGGLQAVSDLADAVLGAETQDVKSAQETLQEMTNVLGLPRAFAQPDPEVQAGWEIHLKEFAAHIVDSK